MNEILGAKLTIQAPAIVSRFAGSVSKESYVICSVVAQGERQQDKIYYPTG